MSLKYEVWLHFQKVNTVIYVNLAAAGGAGAIGSPVPLSERPDDVRDRLLRAGWPAKGIDKVLLEIEQNRVASSGPIRMTSEQCAVLGLTPQTSQIPWGDVRAWTEQLNECPPGSIGDSLCQDLTLVVNQCRSASAWDDVCASAQVAIVEYQKRKADG